jgi:hypothetical protein
MIHHVDKATWNDFIGDLPHYCQEYLEEYKIDHTVTMMSKNKKINFNDYNNATKEVIVIVELKRLALSEITITQISRTYSQLAYWALLYSTHQNTLKEDRL